MFSYLDIWKLEFVWDLEFGYWSLIFNDSLVAQSAERVAVNH